MTGVVDPKAEADARARHAEVRSVFLRCRGLGDEERKTALKELDARLRCEVEELLAAETADDALSDRRIDGRDPLAPWIATAAEAEAEEPLPERIAGFRVLRRLGAGGMGVVYEAEQEAPRRRVALKLVRAGLAHGERFKRFRLEAEALGRLQHPGIAQIFDFGTADLGQGEQPFFVMELVEGRPLLVHAAEARLDRRARLALVAELCDAVQHAHERGVVHRDLKPDNVLVDAAGRAKVLDFGVARVRAGDVPLTTIHTAQGQIVGTLTHMAPEQLEGDPDAVGPAADVYALGVIAFEILTGHLPHEVAGLSITAAVRRVTEVEAPRLGHLDRALRGDIETIVAKALETNPARRYVTAAALAADLRRYLGDEPIQARPPSTIYRLRKFVRRNPGLVTAAALVLLSLVVGLGWALVERARADRRAAEQAAQAYRANLVVAAQAVADGRMNSARSFLEVSPPELRGWEWRYLDARLDPGVRRFDLGVTINDFCVSADGRTLVVATGEGTVQEISTSTGAVLRTLQAPGIPDHCALSDDGLRLTAVGVAADDPSISVWVASWSLPEGRSLESVVLDPSLWHSNADGFQRWWQKGPGDPGHVRSSLDADRRRLVLQWPGRLEALDLDRQVVVASRPVGQIPQYPRWSRDGRYVISLNSPDEQVEEIDILDGVTLEPRGRLAGYHDKIVASAISPDGGRLATTAMDGALQVWNLAAATSSPMVGQPLFTMDAQQGEIRDVAFTQDGAHLLTAGANRTIRGWNSVTGAPWLDLPSQEENIRFIDNVPGTDEIVSVSESGSVRFWSLRDSSPVVLRGHQSFVYAVDVDRELGLILTGGWDGFEGQSGGLRLWDLESSDPVAAWDDLALGCVRDAAFLPGEAAIVTLTGGSPMTGRADLVTRLDLASGSSRVVRRVERPDSSHLFPLLRSLRAGHAPGRAWTMTLGESENEVHELDLGSGEFMRAVSFEAEWARAIGWVEHPLAVSPTGRWLALAINRSRLVVLRAEDLSVAHDLELPDDWLQATAFDAGERRLLSCSETGTVRVWDLASGRQLTILAGHDGGVLCAAFDPSGTRIATGGRDGTLRIWSGESYQQLLSLDAHERYIYALTWLDDGERILTASGDHTVRIFETRPVRERYRAHEERQALVDRLTPRVEAWLAEHEPAELGALLQAATDLTPRERQVARQIWLGRILGLPEDSGRPVDHR